MAAIRIPASAELLLSFCRTSGTPGPHLWETYADMIAFLASYACSSEVPLSDKAAVLKTANAIDLGIFRSRGLYSILLTVCIAEQGDWLIAKQPDKLADIVERYAAAGATLLFSEISHPSLDALSTRILARMYPPTNNSVSI